MINRIQNKSFCLHNVYVYGVYLICIYKYTHIYYIFWKYLHVFLDKLCNFSQFSVTAQYSLHLSIYTALTALQKFGNALEKWGFGQYWHESFLICDNFALIRDNTYYENIFYYINSLYIEKTLIFDSSKYPPLAAITALHNLGIRAVSLFKHWLWIGNRLLKLQY